MARTRNRPRRNSAFHLPNAFDLFKPSKDLVLKNIWIFGPIYAVPFIFYLHAWLWSPLPNQHTSLWHHAGGFSSGWPGSPAPTYFTFLAVSFSLLWLFIVASIGTVAQIMANAAQLDSAQGKQFDFSDLWRVVKQLGWRMLGLYIVVFFVILIGFILIIPGFIFLRRYFLSPYVMIDKKLGIRDAMDESARLSKLNTGSVWGVLGVMFLIGLVNIVPIVGGITSFALGALYSVAPALRYQQLKKLAP